WSPSTWSPSSRRSPYAPWPSSPARSAPSGGSGPGGGWGSPAHPSAGSLHPSPLVRRGREVLSAGGARPANHPLRLRPLEGRVDQLRGDVAHRRGAPAGDGAVEVLDEAHEDDVVGWIDPEPGAERTAPPVG